MKQFRDNDDSPRAVHEQAILDTWVEDDSVYMNLHVAPKMRRPVNRPSVRAATLSVGHPTSSTTRR